MNVLDLAGLCFGAYLLLFLYSKQEKIKRDNKRREQLLSEFRPSEYPDDSYLRPRGEGLDDWREVRYRRGSGR